MSQLAQETLLTLLSQVRSGESISPNDVAKAMSAENWQRELPKVRAVILSLVREGRIEVVRKGKPVDLEGLKGIYRIRLVPQA
ncbi:hypothetical protein ABAC460_16620 [Asticcacaulis sp. AC460]|uniref:DUF3253 domain-containing protein n=1 Tax=Asticcacaulis sp. AC460 TaxID=1282360 RepID=UPI0003C3F437|nr:DUF3253 domain-containing protein [Asticcacaulis sp. AC460]ESQ88283.1 hypothetical protein ABAC460_16620 [Asticcacaulis sp. AC460]